MKKITLVLVAFILVNTSFAQTPSEKIVLSKSQKLLTSTTVNGTVNMEMMGQNMETVSETAISSTVEVKEVTPTGYTLTNTVNKMKLKTKGGMAPTVDFDSDKKEDMNGEIGKKVKDKLQPKDIEITFAGKPVEKKSDEENMEKLMQTVRSGAGDNGITGIFMLVPAGKKSGDVWTDSSNVNGIKINNTYTLKQINGNDATIAVNTVSNINKTTQALGTDVTIVMDSKISSDNIVDLTTGLIKEKRTTVEGKGNLGAAGQEMPMTTKVTSVTTVKSM